MALQSCESSDGSIQRRNIENPNHLQQQYPDEVLKSVYWSHRSQYHKKLVERDDSVGVSNLLDRAAEFVRSAQAVLFVTGAGAGCDMGLPDFRSSMKFWEDLAHPEIRRYEDSSDSEWFEKDPELAWGLNYHQIDMYRSANIHAGYEAMIDIGKMKSNNYFCFTSNIDGVLQRAGMDECRVREIHGNIHRLQCINYDCLNPEGKRSAWKGSVQLAYDSKSFRCTSQLPQCAHCGGMARPNVWFCKDRNYVLYESSSRVSDDYFRWLASVEERRQKTVVIECGAGLAIPSARCEAEDVAERLGGSLIRINPVDYQVPVDGVNGSEAIGIPLGCAEAMTGIWRRLHVQ